MKALDDLRVGDRAIAGLRDDLVRLLRGRGWHHLLGKRKGGEQSLLEHCLNAFDVVVTLLPALRRSMKPTPAEEQAMLTGVIAHDAGKERDEWQAYVRGRGPWCSDTTPEHARALIEAVFAAWPPLGAPEDALSAVLLHMKNERTTVNVARELLAPHASSRWRLVGEVVQAADQIVSAETAAAACRKLRPGPDSNPLARSIAAVAYHQLAPRGVSTPFLHAAARRAFEEAGYSPLLFFSDATVYFASEPPRPVGRAALKDNLAAALSEVILARRERLPELVVGDIGGDFLPAPDLFGAGDLPLYLNVAARRAGPKKPDKVTPKNVLKAFNGIHGTNHAKEAALPPEEAARLREALGESQPEMAIFKFYKNVFDPAKKLVGSEQVDFARKAHDALFGPDAFDRLMSMSTLMPAEDYLTAVRPFHDLTASSLGDKESGRVGALPKERRQKLLRETLAKIAGEVFATMVEPPSSARLAPNMTQAFLEDVVVPEPDGDGGNSAQEQLAAYTEAKLEKGKGTFLCPLCNAQARRDEAKEPKADWYPKPESFTNRRRAYTTRGVKAICLACYYDRILSKVLLGFEPKEYIAILPSRNLSVGGGDDLERRVRGLIEESRRMLAPEDMRAGARFDLAGTWAILQSGADVDGLDDQAFATAFTYRVSQEKLRDRVKELAKVLEKERFEGVLVDLNEIAGTTYPSFREAAEAISVGTAPRALVADVAPEVKAAWKLAPQSEIIAVAPNLILIPLSTEFGPRDVSETKAGLHRLLATIFIARALGTTAAVVPANELSKVLRAVPEGVAFVSPTAPLRRLVRCDWVSLTDTRKWYAAIIGANRLARKAEYPPRNDIYEVLTQPAIGKILRRIEDKGNTIRLEELESMDAVRTILEETEVTA